MLKQNEIFHFPHSASNFSDTCISHSIFISARRGKYENYKQETFLFANAGEKLKKNIYERKKLH